MRYEVGCKADWRTKPTDRFILKWIKLHLSAPITGVVYRLLQVRVGRHETRSRVVLLR